MMDRVQAFGGPRWSAVAAEQFRLVGLQLRIRLGVLAVLAAGVAVMYWRMRIGAPAMLYETFAGLADGMAALVAVLLALLAWTDEGPSRRVYHWTMPVPRWLHGLLRVGAGAAWCALVMIPGVIIALLGGLVTVGQVAAASVGVLLVYLLTSIAAVASNHPDRWVIGVPGMYIAAGVIIAATLGRDAVFEAWKSIQTGRLGFAAAVSPSSILAGEWAAAALWYAIAAAGLALALGWHRE